MTPLPQSEGGSAGSGIFRQANFSSVTPASLFKSYLFSPAIFNDDLTCSPQTPANVDVSAFPVISREAGVDSFENVRIGNVNGSINYTLDFTTLSGLAVRTLTSTISSTYFRYSEEAVLELLESGKTKHAYIAGARNAASWWPNITAVPYSTPSGGGKCGALVTPRHLLGVTHYPLPVGSTVTFKAADSADHARTVQAAISCSGKFSDLRLYLLSADLPVAIQPAPIVGDWANLVSDSAGSYVFSHQHVGIWLDQNRECCFSDAGAVDGNTEPKPTGAYFDIDLSTQFPWFFSSSSAYSMEKLPSLDAYRSVYKTGGVSGDSGSAVFLPVAGGWAVACTLTGPNGGVALREAILNKMIEQVDILGGVVTNHSVTVAPDPTI